MGHLVVKKENVSQITQITQMGAKHKKAQKAQIEIVCSAEKF